MHKIVSVNSEPFIVANFADKNNITSQIGILFACFVILSENRRLGGGTKVVGRTC